MSGEKLLLEALIRIRDISLQYGVTRELIRQVANTAIRKYIDVKEDDDTTNIPNCS